MKRGNSTIVRAMSFMVVLSVPCLAFAGGGAGEGPPGQEPGSPSIVGNLKISVSKDGNSLNGEISGRCGPLASDVTKTEKFDLTFPVPPLITVGDFAAATAAQAAALLDGFFLDLNSIPAALQVCLDVPGTAPQFAVYPHRIMVKDEDYLIADVVLLNWVPIGQ